MANTNTPTLEAAVLAQAAFVSEYTAHIAAHGYTDDDIDYLPGALALLAGVQSDHYASLSGEVPNPSQAQQAVTEHGAYPGDYGPQSVFDAIGMHAGAAVESVE